MKIKPVNHNLLVEQQQKEERTAGGILLPDTAKDSPSIGVIKRINDDCILYKEDQRVLFKKWNKNTIEGQESLVLIHEEDILAIIED